MRWIWLVLVGGGGGACATLLAKESAAQDFARPPSGEAPSAPAAAPAKPTDAPNAPTPPTASSPAGSATTPPSAPPTKPEPSGPPKETDKTKAGSAPPEYYVEDQKKGALAPGVSPGGEIYEPPPPPVVVAEPPPPIQPNYIAPKTAFWAGLRLAYFVPFGTLWYDGADVGQAGLVYRRRLFSAYASPGPAAEVDVGARIGRRYNLFAMWEHASLGAGNLDQDSFGGQQRGSTNLYGVGFRFSTQPNTVGFLLEIGLGYRDFRAYWSDGTGLVMNDTFFDARIGLGVDIRVNKWLSLSPMVVFGEGSFQSARFSSPAGGHGALTALDQDGEYGTFSLQIGAHADVF